MNDRREGPLRVVVCIKMVPDTTRVSIDPATNTLVREGIPFITNPFDEHAVEEALRLKDTYGARVTVVSMGPRPAESVIRLAIARGADGGVLVSDRAFAGSDTLATGRIIASAVRRLSEGGPVDLVICGRQTIDGDTAQVGPAIAARLGFSQVTLVDKVMEVHADQGKMLVRAKLDDRYEVIEARLPALITVVREINRPRYPSVEGRLLAEESAVPLWDNEALKLDPGSIGLQGSPTWVKRIFAPERKMGEVMHAVGEKRKEAISRIVDRLEAWKILDSLGA